ncbi:hypothetical protein Pcinc_035021 [Petrolisthes cinctipes]|uniref:Uncharacterized protein n=1 Tax=Petrolisthes cinctipes TaxID=88211 RepID=A0AAE1BZ57_PETCI|nr:hypothetical protein Pcinc_035021 [Petrolisthes cinctipes]
MMVSGKEGRFFGVDAEDTHLLLLLKHYKVTVATQTSPSDLKWCCEMQRDDISSLCHVYCILSEKLTRTSVMAGTKIRHCTVPCVFSPPSLSYL